MYMHIRPCLADNFVHVFLSGFFHERHNLDLFHFKPQDFYDKKKMVLYRSVDNCVNYFSYVSEKNEAKFIQLFVKAAVFSSKPSFMYNN